MLGYTIHCNGAVADTPREWGFGRAFHEAERIADATGCNATIYDEDNQPVAGANPSTDGPITRYRNPAIGRTVADLLDNRIPTHRCDAGTWLLIGFQTGVSDKDTIRLSKGVTAGDIIDNPWLRGRVMLDCQRTDNPIFPEYQLLCAGGFDAKAYRTEGIRTKERDN